jgi:hypothetical protein
LSADDAFPLAAGGVDGGEGSVIICVEASVEKLDELMTLVTGIKGRATGERDERGLYGLAQETF